MCPTRPDLHAFLPKAEWFDRSGRSSGLLLFRSPSRRWIDSGFMTETLRSSQLRG